MKTNGHLVFTDFLVDGGRNQVVVIMPATVENTLRLTPGLARG